MNTILQYCTLLCQIKSYTEIYELQLYESFLKQICRWHLLFYFLQLQYEIVLKYCCIVHLSNIAKWYIFVYKSSHKSARYIIVTLLDWNNSPIGTKIHLKIQFNEPGLLTERWKCFKLLFNCIWPVCRSYLGRQVPEGKVKYCFIFRPLDCTASIHQVTRFINSVTRCWSKMKPNFLQ